MKCRSASACRSRAARDDNAAHRHSASVLRLRMILFRKLLPRFGIMLWAQKKGALLRVLRPAQRAKAPHGRVFRPESGGREGERRGPAPPSTGVASDPGLLLQRPRVTLRHREKSISDNDIADIGEGKPWSRRASARRLSYAFWLWPASRSWLPAPPLHRRRLSIAGGSSRSWCRSRRVAAWTPSAGRWRSGCRSGSRSPSWSRTGWARVAWSGSTTWPRPGPTAIRSSSSTSPPCCTAGCTRACPSTWSRISRRSRRPRPRRSCCSRPPRFRSPT